MEYLRVEMENLEASKILQFKTFLDEKWLVRAKGRLAKTQSTSKQGLHTWGIRNII